MKLRRIAALMPQLIILLLVAAGGNAIGAEPTLATRHTVIADGHPLAVWQKSAVQADEAILLVHGRTWSALPLFIHSLVSFIEGSAQLEQEPL